MSIYAIFQYFNIDFLPLTPGRGAIIATIGNPNFLAAAIAPCIFIILDFILNKKTNKLFFIILLLVILSGILITKTRASLISPGISLFLFVLVFNFKLKIRKEIFIKLLIGFFSFTIILLYIFSVRNIDSSLKFRFWVYHNTLIHSNFLGKGQGAFFYFFHLIKSPYLDFTLPAGATPKFVHNDFIQIAFESGFLGCSIFILFITLIFSNKSLLQKNIFIYFALLCLVINSFFSFVFYRPISLFIFFLLLSLLFPVKKQIYPTSLKKSAILKFILIFVFLVICLKKIIYYPYLDKLKTNNISNKQIVTLEKINFTNLLYDNLGMYYHSNFIKNNDYYSLQKAFFYYSILCKNFKYNQTYEYNKAAELENLINFKIIKDKYLLLGELKNMQFFFSKTNDGNMNRLYLRIKDYFYNSQFILMKKILRKNLKDEKTLLQAGIFYLNNKIFKKSLRYYKYYLKFDPNSIDALNNIGNIFYQTKGYSKALKYFKQAQKINPYNYQINNNIATIYYVLKDYEQAKQYFSFVIKYSKDINQKNYALKMKNHIKNILKKSN